MRYGTIAAAALTLAAACATAPEPAQAPRLAAAVPLLEAPCATDAAAFPCARESEADAAARTEGRVRRAGDSLYLRVGADRAVALADGAEGTPQAVRYAFVEAMDGLGQYLVAVYDTRGRTYALVNAATGQQEIVAGRPLVSPDGRRFVAAASVAEAGGVRGTLEVWRVEGGAVTREFTHRSEGWWADQPRWMGNAAIRFVRTAESPDGTSFQQRPAWLRREGDAWRLDPPAQ